MQSKDPFIIDAHYTTSPKYSGVGFFAEIQYPFPTIPSANMDHTFGTLSIIAFCVASLLIARLFRPPSFVDLVLIAFTALTSMIIASGFLLSSLNKLSNVGYWVLVSLFLLFLSILISTHGRLRKGRDTNGLILKSWKGARSWFAGMSLFERILVLPPVVTLLLLGLVNLFLIIFVAPHNWDSLAYHLARMAYYIQHGSMDYFEANYWAQVVHPKNSTVLFLYTYLVSGKNENLIQLVQFVSYWMSIGAVYVTSRRLGGDITASVFAAAVFGLLIESLMQAVTTQNDLIWTAFLAISLYGFVSYRVEMKSKYLVLASTGIALALGVKASSLMALPSLGIVAAAALIHRPITRALRDSAMLIASGVLALSLFCLPSGYYDNYVRFGNPIGPSEVVSGHSFVGTSSVRIIQEGSKNLLRYGTDFISLDGLPPSGFSLDLHKLLRSGPIRLIRFVGVNRDSSKPFPAAFDPQKIPIAHEDLSSWGVLGFALVWIAVLVALFSRSTSPPIRVLALTAMIYFVVLSFAGPYVAWFSRYFLFAGVLGAPTILVTMKWVPSRCWRVYLVGIAFAGCLSAISAVVLRPLHDSRGYYKSQSILSLLGRDRMGQLTTNVGKFYRPLSRFEEIVPKNAIVAVCLTQSGFEYPLFGEKLTRTLIPLNSFVNGVQPVPKEAGFLLFSSEVLSPTQEDEFLGEAWYLRKPRR